MICELTAFPLIWKRLAGNNFFLFCSMASLIFLLPRGLLIFVYGYRSGEIFLAGLMDSSYPWDVLVRFLWMEMSLTLVEFLKLLKYCERFNSLISDFLVLLFYIFLCVYLQYSCTSFSNSLSSSVLILFSIFSERRVEYLITCLPTTCSLSIDPSLMKLSLISFAFTLWMARHLAL